MKYSVVIGRFQVPELSEAHLHLLRKARNENKGLLILIGSPRDIGPTKRDPLSFEQRMWMIKSIPEFEDAIIFPIQDHPCDKEWSKNVDLLISSITNEAVLYGGRDSFIPHYKGKFKTQPIGNVHWNKKSGTQLRQECLENPQATKDFRAGVIHCAGLMYPTSYQCVDIIVHDTVNKQILVGIKNHYNGFIFPGGFVDVEDCSLEMAAARELREEVPDLAAPGSEAFKYLGSLRIDDWRYKKQDHKIMTAVFVVHYTWGILKAGDDLDDVKKVNYPTVEQFAEQHRPIYNLFREKVLGQSIKPEVPF